MTKPLFKWKENNYLHKGLLKKMFMTELFIVSQSWRLPKCPLTDEWINKMQSIHTVNYCSVIERNQLLMYAAPWMTLRIVMLSVRTQTQETTWYKISFSCNSGNMNYPIVIESRSVIPEAEGCRGARRNFGNDDSVPYLKWDRGFTCIKLIKSHTFIGRIWLSLYLGNLDF